jgi:hypothetical protein
MAVDDLISLEEARAFLEKDERETAQDPILNGLITAASAEIMKYTKREFAPKGDAVEERRFLFVGARTVDLEPYDVREVESVTLGVDLPSSRELAAGEWTLRPVTAPYGVYQSVRLRLAPGGAPNLPAGEQTCAVAVTGKWGFASVPEDVKHWCKVTVATWLRKDVAAFSRTLQLEEDRVEAPEQLPSAAMRGLCNYKRRAPLVPR